MPSKIRAAFVCTSPWGLSCDALFENSGAGRSGGPRVGSAGVVDGTGNPSWQPLGAGPGTRFDRGEFPGSPGRPVACRLSVVAARRQPRGTARAEVRLVAS